MNTGSCVTKSSSQVSDGFLQTYPRTTVLHTATTCLLCFTVSFLTTCHRSTDVIGRAIYNLLVVVPFFTFSELTVGKVLYTLGRLGTN